MVTEERTLRGGVPATGSPAGRRLAAVAAALLLSGAAACTGEPAVAPPPKLMTSDHRPGAVLTSKVAGQLRAEPVKLSVATTASDARRTVHETSPWSADARPRRKYAARTPGARRAALPW
jgi:hypothetical protein